MSIILIFLTMTFKVYSHNAGIEHLEVHGQKVERTNREQLAGPKRVEALDVEHLRRKNAKVLSDALDNEAGIDAQVSCANCNSKRLTINGMRGEHTTILIDGIPLYSTVSSFYGMDAIPIMGVQSIEVMRGSGKALSAPESIGGAVNIRTLDPFSHQAKFEASIGANDYRYLGAGGATNWQDGDQGLAIATQNLQRGFWDLDKNQMAEVPSDQGQAFQGKYAIKKGQFDLSFRAGIQNLEIIGGNTNGYRARYFTLQKADENDFENGDVRNNFIGEVDRISDWIKFEREEYALQINKEITPDLSIHGSAGLALQKQESIYMHGYDYANSDTLNFNDIHARYFIGTDHLIKFGIDNRNHQMNSDSIKLFDQQGYAKDSFKHQTFGLYIQDEWSISEDLEIMSVLRADKITVDWTDYGLGNEVDETILAPRIYLKYYFSHFLSTNFSYGLGYRSPLSLYETQHGSDHGGFLIDIDSLERAHSLSWTLDYRGKPFGFEIGTHYTAIKNMAYGETNLDLSAGAADSPLLFTQYKEELSVWVNELAFLWDVSQSVHLRLGYETFRYQNAYAEKLPIAAIEQRVTLEADVHWSKFESRIFVEWIGSRNLSRYGYDSHFNRYDGIDGFDQKWQKAPSYFTLDWNLQYHANKELSLLAGVQNLFNYTQTRAGDPPATWDFHIDHYHLDNFHIWGPLMGRRWFFSAQYSF